MIEVTSVVTGSVWKIEASIGQRLEPGESIMILESMKMEIPVIVEDGGTLRELRVAEGVAVTEGQVVAVIEE
ncbi:MAG: acetyl-CoA carboxylase biotin carboxyl carrier protein subunit [Betaproteobacteria bacterium]|jgi:acetyl-CoA carboxylase biotin carboxyl carrier protein|nr:acetyl-CoA carboxylase biotin carboxyl carrier protein subunit [Betaproteobacteria bacterium]